MDLYFFVKYKVYLHCAAENKRIKVLFLFPSLHFSLNCQAQYNFFVHLSPKYDQLLLYAARFKVVKIGCKWSLFCFSLVRYMIAQTVFCNIACLLERLKNLTRFQ